MKKKLKPYNKQKAAYMLIMYLLGALLGIYYTYTRTVIGKEYGEDYGFIALMVALESIPGFFAVLLGFASDRIGRKKMLYTGFLASLILLLMGNTDVKYYPLLAFGYMFFYMSFQPTVYGTILHKVEGKGLSFSWYLLLGSLGWATGGLLPGLIERAFSDHAVFPLSSILLVSATVLSIRYYPESLFIEKTSLRDFSVSIKRLSYIVVGLVIGSAGIGLFIGSYALKLYSMLEDTLVFGVIFSSIPGIFGTLVRPLTGFLVDKFSPEKILTSVFIAYMLLGLIIINLTGLPIILLWFTPLYPFYETSGYTMLSRRLPSSLQATAAGLFSTSVSISGILNILASTKLARQDFKTAIILSSSMLLIGALWIFFSTQKNKSKKYDLFIKQEK